MLTQLEPCYKFTDGTAYVVGNHADITANDRVKVYVLSVMSEITQESEPKYYQEVLDQSGSLFLNKTGTEPLVPTTIESQNFITVKSSNSFILKQANEELIRRNERRKRTVYATNIPNTTTVRTGTSVHLKSDVGTLYQPYLD